MTGTSKPLSSIPQFSRIVQATPEQIAGSGEQGKKIAGQVASQVLAEISRSGRVPEDAAEEYRDLSQFIQHMELFGAEAGESEAFRTTLLGLKTCQAGIHWHSNRIYQFYSAPDAKEQLSVNDANTRKRLVDQTGVFIQKLVADEGHTLLPAAELKQIHRNLCAVGIEIWRTQDAEALAAWTECIDQFEIAFGWPLFALVLEREKNAANIQDRVMKLSATSPQLREDVRQLKQEIRDLKAIVPSSEAAVFKPLEEALDALVHPDMAKISEDEYALIAALSHSDTAQLAAYGDLEKASLQEARQTILQRLQEASAGGMRELLNQAPQALAGIKEKAAQNRLAKLSRSLVTQDFIELAPSLMRDMQRYRQHIRESLDNAWSQSLESEEFAHLGDLEQRKEFFKQYPKYDPQATSNQIEEQLIKRRLAGLPLDGQIVKRFRQACNTSSDEMDRISSAIGFREGKRAWIASQGSHLKIPYNQGADVLLSRGACLSNSVRRCAEVAVNPGAQLAPGATQVSRTRQNRYVLENEKTGKGEPTLIRQYGLRVTERRSFEHPSDLVQFATGHPMMLLTMRGSAADGHAINVQIDPERGIYRLVDDVVGLCEYDTQEDLIKALQDLIKAVYPNQSNELELIGFEIQPLKRKR